MNIESLKENVKKYEGLKLKPYLCPAKKLTIGYGRNIQDVGITKKEADLLLENDLLNIKLTLIDKLSFFTSLDDVRQNVLIEMAYNMGVPRLLKFKNTLNFIKNKDYEKASIEMLDSKWHRDFLAYDLLDGRKYGGLLRSEHLSKIMKEGKY